MRGDKWTNMELFSSKTHPFGSYKSCLRLVNQFKTDENGGSNAKCRHVPHEEMVFFVQTSVASTAKMMTLRKEAHR